MAYIGNSPNNIQQARTAEYEFTATLGQTTFSGVDDNGLTLDLLNANQNEVYLNGSRLVSGDDFNILGDDLTLTSAAAVGDILVIKTQSEVLNAGTYTKAESDSRYVNYSGDIINGDLQVVGNIDVDGINLSDDDVITFGSSSTKIFRTPQRNFVFRNDDNEDIFIDAQDVFLRVNRPNGFENAVAARSNGSVSLYYDAAEKLETVSTGINVTGTVTADGLSSDGALLIQANAGNFTKIENDGKKVAYFQDDCDVSFYEGTGTNAKFFWDASAESLTVPISKINDGSTGLDINPRSYGVQLGTYNVNQAIDIRAYGSTSASYLNFATKNADRMRIDSNGNIGIGTNSPAYKLDVLNAAEGAQLRLKSSFAVTNKDDTIGGIVFEASDGSSPTNDAATLTKILAGNDYGGHWDGNTTRYDTNLTFHTASNAVPSERMRIDSSGDVGIGTSSPRTNLDIIVSGGNDWSTTVTNTTNAKGIFVTSDSNNNDMTGIWMGAGSGTHFSGIVGARTAHTSHWGTHLGFYTHNDDTANLNTATEKVRITGNGHVIKKSPHTSNDQSVEGFFSKYVDTNFTNIFTADMNSTHEGLYYEVITYGGDWGSHSAARVCKRGFINGYNGYIGHEVLESSGQYGDNILSNVTWTGNGGVVTFQLRLDSGGVTLRGHIRLIGSFSTYTIG
jgi:hypothetical protein